MIRALALATTILLTVGIPKIEASAQESITNIQTEAQIMHVDDYSSMQDSSSIEPNAKGFVLSCVLDANIPSDISDYDKAIIINDYLKKHLVYDDNAATMTGRNKRYWQQDFAPFTDYCLLTGRAVCGGYSEAFQSMCEAVGIETYCVVGDAMGMFHEWNVFVADGIEYSIDVTWNDGTETENPYITQGTFPERSERGRYVTYKISGSDFSMEDYRTTYGISE